MEIEFIRIKNYKTVTWKGFGTSLCWFANGIDTSNEFRDYISDLLFNQSNTDGLQLNIVRYNIGASIKNDVTGFRRGGAVPMWDTNNLDSDIDKNQIYFLKAAKNSGVKTFEAFANSPPITMTRSGDVAGNRSWSRIFKSIPNFTLSTNLKWNQTLNFSKYLVAVTDYLIRKEDIPFTSISPINEPSGPGWVSGNNQEGCFYGYLNRTFLFNNLYNELQKSQSSDNVKLSGCEENNMFQALCGIVCNPFVWKYVGQYNIHRYRINKVAKIQDSNTIRKIVNFIIKDCLNKPIWMSEFGMGYEGNTTNYKDIQNAFNLANYIIDDLTYLKPEAWIYWQVIEDNSGNGWGLVQMPFINPSKNSIVYGSQFVAFQHFTHFIKPGDHILSLCSPRNTNIKWIGSINPLTNIMNIIVLSKNTSDFVLEIPFKNHNTKIRMMITTGDNNEWVTKTNIFNLYNKKIIIPAKSLVSMRIIN